MYTNLKIKKVKVNVVSYDIFDHMPVVYDVLCENTTSSVLRSIHNLFKFEVTI